MLKRRSSGGIRADDKDVKDLLFEGVEPLSAVDATHVVLTGKDTYLQVVRSPLVLAGSCSYSAVLRDVTPYSHLSDRSPAYTVASRASCGVRKAHLCLHVHDRSVCLFVYPSICLSIFLSF